MVELARSKTLCKLTLRVCIAGSESRRERLSEEDKGEEEAGRSWVAEKEPSKMR